MGNEYVETFNDIIFYLQKNILKANLYRNSLLSNSFVVTIIYIIGTGANSNLEQVIIILECLGIILSLARC